MVVALARIADRLRQMVVKRKMNPGHERQIGGDVAVANGNFAVLHILRVHKQDLVDQVQVLQQDCADQSVEIATRYKTELLRFSRHFAYPFK